MYVIWIYRTLKENITPVDVCVAPVMNECVMWLRRVWMRVSHWDPSVQPPAYVQLTTAWSVAWAPRWVWSGPWWVDYGWKGLTDHYKEKNKWGRNETEKLTSCKCIWRSYVINRMLCHTPKQVPCYCWAVDCDTGRRKKHGIEHQGWHDGIQKFIWGIWVGLLFLLMSICQRLYKRHKEFRHQWKQHQ